MFVNLHNHTEYSLLDGAIKIKELFKRAKELGASAIGISDHGHLGGTIKKYKLAKEAGIKLIIGCEIYLVRDMKERDNKTEKRFHLVLYAKNNTGYKNLMKIVSEAAVNGFYYKPRIDKENLKKYSEGIICTSACLQNDVAQEILAGNIDKARELIKGYIEMFGKDNYFLEVANHNIPEEKILAEEYFKLAKEFDIRVIFGNDAHYLYESHSISHATLLCIQSSKTVTDPNRFKFDGCNHHLLSEEEARKLFPNNQEVFDNTVVLADMCNVKLELGKPVFPDFPLPEGYTHESYLKELCYIGLKGKYIENYEEAKKRLDYELGVINKMGYAEYFLIVADVIKEVGKIEGIQTAGRGCFIGDTKVSLLDGKEITMKELCEKYPDKEFEVYSCLTDGEIVRGTGRNPRVTGYVDKLCRVMLDNGETIGCTSDHRFMLRNGKYCEARDLVTGVSLMPLYRQDSEFSGKSRAGYETYFDNKNGGWNYTHYIGQNMKRGYVMHHVNFTKRDNRSCNLHRMAWRDHGILHSSMNKSPEQIALVKEGRKKYYKMNPDRANDLNLRILSDSNLWKERSDRISKLNKSEKKRAETIARNKDLGFRKKVSDGRKKFFISEAGSKERENISRRFKGRVIFFSEETKKKLSASLSRRLTGKTWEETFGEDNALEMKRKMSIRQKNKIPYQAGKKWDELYGIEKANEMRQNLRRLRAGTFNHKVISVEIINLDSKIPVYDIEVDAYHNFALSAGVFVHNSAGGSVAGYCLGMHQAEPIANGLLFERFLNPDRVSLPDIDTDFANRDIAIDYVKKKYGQDKVAVIGTYGTLACKLAVKDAARAHGVPYEEANAVTKLFISDKLDENIAIPEVKDFFGKYPQLLEIAPVLQDLIKFQGTHASGVTIGLQPTVEYSPVRLSEGQIVTQYDMDEIEAVGLVKMDFLGLDTMNIEYNILKMIGKDDEWLRQIPMDDTATYEMLQKGDAVGVFQMEHGGMIDATKKVKPTEFNDIVAIISLYRPGSMDYVDVYANRKNGIEEVEYDHAKLEPILRSTYGVLIYQEQLMHLVRELAGFTMPQADLLRRGVGKKKIEVIKSLESTFREGCKKHSNMDDGKISMIWEKILKFADYSFNKSHAWVYGLSSYRTAYLKCHYPVEYMTAVINSFISDNDKVVQYIGEARKMGIKILPPDINISGGQFVADNGAIRFGLGGIKNVAGVSQESIISNRPYKSFVDFMNKVDISKANRRVQKHLIEAGCFDFTGVNRHSMLAGYVDIVPQEKGKERQLTLFGTSNMEYQFPKRQEPTLLEKIRMEQDAMGISASGNIIDLYPEAEDYQMPDELYDGQQVTAFFMITEIKKVYTKKDQSEMAFITIDNKKGSFEAVVFPRLWAEKFKNIVEGNGVVLLLRYQEEKSSFITNDVKKIEPRDNI